MKKLHYLLCKHFYDCEVVVFIDLFLGVPSLQCIKEYKNKTVLLTGEVGNTSIENSGDECGMRCASKPSCKASDYDEIKKNCTLVNSPCVTLQNKENTAVRVKNGGIFLRFLQIRDIQVLLIHVYVVK